MIGGWTKGHRKRFDNPFFKKPYCRGFAWDWMCSMAVIEPKKFDIKGKIVTIQRGQFATSFTRLQAQFGWSRSVCQLFLTRLKTDTAITVATDTGQMIITICNYERYQGDIPEVDTAKKTQSIRDRYGIDTQNKKEKNLKKESIGQNFDEFWNIYPRKTAKGTALRAFKGAMKKTDYESLKSGLDSYVETIRANGTEERFIAHPATWLNGERWTDEAPEESTTIPGFEHLLKRNR